MHKVVVLVLATLVPPCALAGVIVVDAANGPGTDYVSLFNAANVAADGDVLLVRAGTYTGPIVDNKNLVIVADTGAFVDVTGSAIVRNLAAGKSVVLRGLDVHNASVPGAGANIYDDVGSVWLEDSRFQGTAGQPGVFQLNAALVVAQRVQGFGADAPSSALGNPLTGGMGFISSAGGAGIIVPTACVWDSLFYGGLGADGTPNKNGAPGGSCLVAGLGTRMYFDGVMGVGGNGGNEYYPAGFQTLYSGSGGSGLFVNPIPHGPVGPVAYRDCLFQGGLPGIAGGAGVLQGSPGLPILDFNNQAAALPGTTCKYNATSPGRAGQSVTLSFAAQPNDTALLLATAVGPQSAAWPNLTAGPLVLPLPFIILATIPLGPTGQLSFAGAVPQLPPSVDAINLWTQALFLTNAGPQLGGGSVITLLAAGF